MGTRFHFAVAGTLLIACGSESPLGGDAGSDASVKKDVATNDTGLGFSDTGLDTSKPAGCGGTDTSSFTPSWQSTYQTPTAFGQNRCTQQQMYDYLAHCAWVGASDPSTCATKTNQPNSLDCFTCLAPGTTTAGPFRTPKDACGEAPSFNIGGCIENALGSSCASAWMSANQCAEVACSECTFCGGGEDVPDYIHPCIQAGGNSGCDNLFQAASCALGSTSPTVKTCLKMVAPTSNNDYLAFASLFCGAPAPSDAGTD